MIDGSASGSGFFSGAYPGPTPGTIPGSLPGSFPGPFTGAFGGPTLNLPFGELAQGIDLMRTMWTQLLNSPITPTLDLEELERRIRDLKAVEQWLAVNQNLLRTTIQGLEIQRTTLATLKAFAGAMARPLHEEPGSAASNATGSSAAHAQASSTPSTAPPKSPGNAAGRPLPPEPQTASFQTGAQAAANTAPAVSQGFAPAMEAAAQQAGQWWQFLQQQFRQLADSAASTLPRVPEPTSAREGAAPAEPLPTPAGPSSGTPLDPPSALPTRISPKPPAADRESPKQAAEPRPRRARPARGAASTSGPLAPTEEDPGASQGLEPLRLRRIPHGPLSPRENEPRPGHPVPPDPPARLRKRTPKSTLHND